MVSIQEDIGPAVVGTGPCVDTVAGGLGAETSAALGMSGTSVGLGVNTSDMPTSKLDDVGL